MPLRLELLAPRVEDVDQVAAPDGELVEIGLTHRVRRSHLRLQRLFARRHHRGIVDQGAHLAALLPVHRPLVQDRRLHPLRLALRTQKGGKALHRRHAETDADDRVGPRDAADRPAQRRRLGIDLRQELRLCPAQVRLRGACIRHRAAIKRRIRDQLAQVLGRDMLGKRHRPRLGQIGRLLAHQQAIPVARIDQRPLLDRQLLARPCQFQPHSFRLGPVGEMPLEARRRHCLDAAQSRDERLDIGDLPLGDQDVAIGFGDIQRDLVAPHQRLLAQPALLRLGPVDAAAHPAPVVQRLRGRHFIAQPVQVERLRPAGYRYRGQIAAFGDPHIGFGRRLAGPRSLDLRADRQSHAHRLRQRAGVGGHDPERRQQDGQHGGCPSTALTQRR